MPGTSAAQTELRFLISAYLINIYSKTITIIIPLPVGKAGYSTVRFYTYMYVHVCVCYNSAAESILSKQSCYYIYYYYHVYYYHLISISQ